MENRNRLIIDLCNPTKDRRPTFRQDIEDDIVVVDYDDSIEGLKQMAEDVCYYAGYDEDEIIEEIEEDGILNMDDDSDLGDKLFETIIDYAASYCSDPGDGTPNLLYIRRNGEVSDYSYPYDCLENLDLATCSERDVKDAILEAEDFVYEDEEFED